MTPAEHRRMAGIAEQEVTEAFKRYLARLVAERLGTGELADLAEQIEVYVGVALSGISATRVVVGMLRAGEDPAETMHDPKVTADMDMLVRHFRLGEELRTP